MTKRALSFNPNHIFVDTNVFVGGYSGDAKFRLVHSAASMTC